MTTTIIANNPPYTFGQQTNQAVAKLIGLNTQLARLGEAIATASSGYQGTPGTEFEGSGAGTSAPPNLFGVMPSETPGEQGAAYSYAMGSLNTAWATFWEAAKPYVEQLDNGQYSM